MYSSRLDIGETHIRLTSDISNHNLDKYIYSIRSSLKSYISKNNDFLISLEPVRVNDDELPLIVSKMIESSYYADVGPMACVAGTISELSLLYLMNKGSSYSIVENGGDIAVVNDEKVLCGIYSDNDILGNNIAFEITPRNEMLGICTSSGKIGHSISFGEADSVSVISKSPSLADGLATRIANEVKGEDKLNNALEACEEFKEFFEGVLIISDDRVASIGRLPKIVAGREFDIER